MQQQQTISQLDCDVWRKLDFTRQSVMTSLSLLWLNWEEASKHFPKTNLHQKQGHGHCWQSTARLTHYSFLNPGEAITSEKHAQQINEMHWNLQLLKLALVNRIGPILLCDNMLHNQSFKDWTNWATKFCLICHIHLTSQQSTTTSSSISTTFLQGKCLHNQKEAENVSKSLSNPKAQIFMLQE